MIKFIAATLLTLACGLSFAATEVNKAGQADLEAVKGIGPGMAARIIEARKTGPFADWADLQGRVKGVGNGNATKFSADGLTVNGTSFSAGAAGAKPVVYKAVSKTEKSEKKAEKARP